MSDDKSLESMSDDEILNMNPPEEEGVQQDQEIEPDSEPVETEDSSPEETEDDVASESEGEDDSVENTPTSETPEVDYKQFYETVMSTTKANGQAFTPRTPEEAVKLMQMGANYTKKMQALAPRRRMIDMLQKADITNEQQLNYLIDIAKGNPEAIKRLISDYKIDPLDLDFSNVNEYVPNNHTVSDAEVRFNDVVSNLSSEPEGKQTLQYVNQIFDDASMSEVAKDPSLLETLHTQRMNGVFDLITNEMQHQLTLGNLNPNMPFLQAYKAVGDYLLSQGTQQQVAQSNLPRGTVTNPVNKTTASVKGVAPTGKSRKAASTFRDPFAMSDEEFEKEFSNYNF